MNTYHNRWLNKFAILTAVCSVILIAAGATVTSTGSGDAVPDWPLAYGKVFPRMIGGILIEHTHRLIASLVSSLVTILALWLQFFSNYDKKIKRLGWFALIAILLQALLGGLRVLVISNPKLQDTAVGLFFASHVTSVRIRIAITHAALAEIVVSIIFVLALVTSQKWNAVNISGDSSRQRQDGNDNRLFYLYALTAIAVFIQVLLGALVRHNKAGTAIPDFPLSYGKLIPPFDNIPHEKNPPFPIPYGEIQFRVVIHFIHRCWAFIVAAIGIFSSTRTIRNNFVSSFQKNVAMAWIALVLCQITLGALVIWTKLAVVITVLHVAIGATLLGLSAMLLVMSKKYVKKNN